MKAAFIPLLGAFLALAAAKGSPDAIFKREDAKCSTPDSEEAPADNDCMAIASKISEKTPGGGVKEPAERWSRLACSDSCAISVYPDEGSEFTYNEVINDVNNIRQACGFNDSKDKVAFMGEITTGGRTTSVFKGGDCEENPSVL